MVKINNPITKSGDDGSTALFGAGRIRKDSIQIETMGSVDELIATLGMLRSLSSPAKVPGLLSILSQIQNQLFDLGSELACAPGNRSPFQIQKRHISFLEKKAKKFNSPLPALNSFVLPGGSDLNAWLHIARVNARRTERMAVKLSGEKPINKFLIIYLNRLSDLLFILARSASHYEQVTEILWEPGKS